MLYVIQVYDVQVSFIIMNHAIAWIILFWWWLDKNLEIWDRIGDLQVEQNFKHKVILYLLWKWKILHLCALKIKHMWI